MENRIKNIMKLIRIIDVKTISGQNVVTFFFLDKKYTTTYYSSNTSLKKLISIDIINIGVQYFRITF